MSPAANLHVLNNYVSVKAASEYSGYSQQYLRRLLRLGKLAGSKLGQLWLIETEAFEVFLALAVSVEDQRFGPKSSR